MKKILIANRGEIALRVMRTCRKMGIDSVVIYAENDRDLPFVKEASEAYPLGFGSLKETYLNQDKIVEICKKSGAEGVHPGYGFLSENEEFCRRLEKEGIIFIGPSVEAISLMGDKETSKRAMDKIGVPLVPGYYGDNQSQEFLEKEASKIGYPVLIKATAGGGGKGMRIVHEEKNFKAELEGAKREALNAFGNDRVLLERYIVNPRHIEVQVMSDSHGNHLHFFERECSIQRRYQKVIEETPSSALDQKLREKICTTAVSITKNINYLGAGTIEFILDPKGEFYFLEMNTRLQVEHPITELVTGYDLVELQIRVASKEKLTIKQSDIKQTGVAIECRIYSEDPDNNFLPTTGYIRHIGKPRDARLDCGYADGNAISTSYDPMLAKLVVHGEDRLDATLKMQEALNELYFSGVKTNRDFLKRIFDHEDYIEGKIHTHFIANQMENLKKRDFSDEELANIIALYHFSENEMNDSYVWNELSHFRTV